MSPCARRSTILRAASIMIVAYLFFGLQLPASWASAICCALSITAGPPLLSSALTVILNSTLFWTHQRRWSRPSLAPALLQHRSPGSISLCHFIPNGCGISALALFRGLLDVPSRIYSGSIPAEHAWLEFFGQLAWTSIFLLIGSWMVNRGLKRLVVQEDDIVNDVQLYFRLIRFSIRVPARLSDELSSSRDLPNFS